MRLHAGLILNTKRVIPQLVRGGLESGKDVADSRRVPRGGFYIPHRLGMLPQKPAKLPSISSSLDLLLDLPTFVEPQFSARLNGLSKRTVGEVRI